MVEPFQLELKDLANQMTGEGLIPVKITRTIYYSEFIEMLDKEVILEVVECQWIGSSTINIWIQYVIHFLIIIYYVPPRRSNCSGRKCLVFLHQSKFKIGGECKTYVGQRRHPTLSSNMCFKEDLIFGPNKCGIAQYTSSN